MNASAELSRQFTSAIVLAAGESRRMGTQKIVLPYGNSTVIQHIVQVLSQGAADEVIVVTGHQSEMIEAALAGTSARTVLNKDYQTGMLSSVRCGIQAATAGTTAFLIALGDQPSIRPPVVKALLAALQSILPDESAILVPLYNARRGHPLLFTRHFREDVLTCFDNTGLRGLLNAFPQQIREVPIQEPGILRDIDTPADYELELEAARKGERDAASPRQPVTLPQGSSDHSDKQDAIKNSLPEWVC